MQHPKQYRSRETRSIFFREPGENPQGKAEDDVIKRNTKKQFQSNGLGPLIEIQEKESAKAANRLGFLHYTEYHQKILLKEGAKEGKREGEYVFQVHLSSTPDKPKPLVIVIEGNANRLDQSLGIDSLYRLLIKTHGSNCDIIKFRMGNSFLDTLNPKLSNDVMHQHFKNVSEDALAGRGIFTGRRYTSIACAGYSYGSGSIDAAVNDEKIWETINPKKIPLVATAYIDGIRLHGGLGVNRPPQPSKNHHHYWQDNRNPLNGGVVICGAPLTVERKGVDRSIKISAANHLKINEPHNDAASRDMYDSIFKFIEEKAQLEKK